MSTESKETELKQLVAKRGQIKATLTRFSTFIDKCKNTINEDSIMQLDSRLENSYPLLEQFNTLQNDIELLNEDESSSNERDLFENNYYGLIQIAKKMVQSFYNVTNASQNNENTSNASSTNQNYPSNTNVRFPIIEIPKFYGDYEKWGQFRDMFKSLVHNDRHLDNIQKFYYLLGSVKGDAAKVIECIEVTNENYNIAWNLLVSRYQNESVIIKHHVSALVELPSVGKEIHIELRKLTDSIKKHIRSLETLGEPVNQWDTLLFHIITKKLDTNTQREWESLFISKTSRNEKPIFLDLIMLLEKRCLLLETMHREKSENKPYDQQNKNKNKHFKTNQQFSGHIGGSKLLRCYFCEGNHPVFSCEKLQSLSVASRLKEINKLKLCTNCLRNNHELKECKAQGCKICKQLHNTMLHTDNFNQNSSVPRNQSNSLNRSGTTTESSHQSGNMQSNKTTPFSQSLISRSDLMTNFCENRRENRVSQIMLSTAIVLIQDASGKWHRCRALLDSGSQPNFITSKIQRILKLSSSNISIPVMGVGSTNLNINQKILTSIKSIHSDFKADLTFLVLDKIAENLPNYSFDINSFKIPSDIVLADYEFNKSREIDMLLGAGIFYELLCSGQVKFATGMPILQQTQLGWVVSGPIPADVTESNQNLSNAVMCNLSINKSLENSIENFWKIEEVSTLKVKSIEEQECETLYSETVKRDNTGHFIVTLPTRDNVGQLGHSAANAIKRLHSMERKFAKNEQFKKQYVNFMIEYESLGHMTQIESTEINNSSSEIYYLPHHGVINEFSETTKLRVVFDGSCKSSSGISLNDLLKVGPTIQSDLLSILLRFREHNVVITGDIAKMYRQVNIAENQRDLQRIVWRSDESDEIKHYRLNTVTYGTSSAAFLAVRSLQQVAIENKLNNPEISKIIINDFYVDDLLTGMDTIEKAIALKRDLTSVLNEYGFPLRKWRSNQAEVLESTDINPQDQYFISEDETRKTLGLYWQSNHDVLTYKLNKSENASEKITKRIILSLISKLFDPLGLLSPIIIVSKILMQSLWDIKLGWDDVPPEHILKAWSQFNKNLQCLDNIQIPRKIIIPNAKHIELHGFCDASQKAYAACVYIKSTDYEDNTLVRLLCSKTRVAPLKTITLPRLELCGAVLLSQLYDKARLSLNININQVFLWTDSTIVLSWIASSPNTLKIFVGNRISEIQNLTCTVQWRHVPTEFNPADIASRGTDSRTLIENTLWWNGPQWLQNDEHFWPKGFDLVSTELEKRNAQITLVATVNELELFSKYSTLYKLQRVLSFCNRFINNSLKRNPKLNGLLTLEELDNSLLMLVKIAQHESFYNDIKCLERSKQLPPNSRLKNLDPFIDSQGFLRVGGRLAKSNLTHDAKHQLILSPHHALTRLIIVNEHHRCLHAGSQTILSSTRQRFWILNGRSAIRNIISKCLTCFRVKPRTLQQKMADLPTDRVTPNRPFYIVGIDFAGPFNIKDEAQAEIQGAPDLYIRAGSMLRLVCTLKHSTEPPAFVFWYHEQRMINYDPGVIITEGRSSSILHVQDADKSHNGNYTCSPSNAVPASINVHVLNATAEEKPAAMQHANSTRSSSSSFLVHCSLLIVIMISILTTTS